MKKKKIFMIVGVILLLLVAIFAFFIFKDLKEEKKLEKEMDEIYEMTDQESIDEEKLMHRLNTYVSSGDYLKVEKALKQYVLDVYNTTKKIEIIFTDEKIEKLLSIENYKKDGKEFKETKSYIKQFVTEAEECKNSFIHYLDNHTIMSYIEDKNLDAYYVDFYKKLAFDEADDYKEEQEEITKAVKEAVDALKSVEKIIDFLIANKNDWYIEEDNIYFHSQELIAQYNKMLEI